MPADLVRGQFRGFLKGTRRGAGFEKSRFAAVQAQGSTPWRWQGVPFYIRAGKCLPVTCTEVMAPVATADDDFPTCTAPDVICGFA